MTTRGHVPRRALRGEPRVDRAARRLLTAVSLAAYFVAGTTSGAAPEARGAEVPRGGSPVPPLPVVLWIGEEDGAPVRDAEWIDAHLATARRLFGRHGLTFRVAARRPLPAKHAALLTRADRDALAPYAQGAAVHVFVVASLLDVDEPGRWRYGVHWRAVSANRRYIVLAAGAPNTVLAHELGHWLGNGHSAARDNLMSYERSGGDLFLDAAQVARAHEIARRALAIGELSVDFLGQSTDAGAAHSP